MMTEPATTITLKTEKPKDSSDQTTMAIMTVKPEEPKHHETTITMVKTEEPKDNDTTISIPATTPSLCDKRKLSPEMSLDQAAVVKKLKDTKTQPGELC